MNTTLLLSGSVCYLDPALVERDKSTMGALRDAFSCSIAGTEFQGGIKGEMARECLVKWYGEGMGVPLGLLPEITKRLQERGYSVDVIDERPPAPELDNPIEYAGPPLRDYQAAMVDRATRENGSMTGRGILVSPPRSGKTLTAAAIIAKLKTRTLFLVPAKNLLSQTARVFKEVLVGADVGWCGDGRWEPGDITVATVQSLLSRPGEAARLISKSGLIIPDEFHHFKNEPWRKLLLMKGPRHIIGLSGTVWFDPNEPAEEGIIWLRAIAGGALYRVSTRRLIDLGHLKRPHILFFPIKGGTTWGGGGGWASFYDKAIVKNHTRNAIIADLADHASQLGLRVLVDTGRKEQMTMIASMLEKRGLSVGVMYGETPLNKRERMLKKFASGELSIIVSTVLGEGQDIPALEVVVNAEGGRSRTAVMQRLRNMTSVPGKGEVLVIDFDDQFSNKLMEHSRDRRTVYESVGAFNIVDVRMKLGAKYMIPKEFAEMCSPSR